MSPSKIESNLNFSYEQYAAACQEYRCTPVTPDERTKNAIARLIKILLPTSAWVHVVFDDRGMEAHLTKPDNHAPFALTVRGEYAQANKGIITASYFSDETHEHGDTISSDDLLDIVEFCLVALRQFRYNFTASRREARS